METHATRLRQVVGALAGAPATDALLKRLAEAAVADQRQALLDAGQDPDALTREQQADETAAAGEQSQEPWALMIDLLAAGAAQALNDAVRSAEAELASTIPPAEI